MIDCLISRNPLKIGHMFTVEYENKNMFTVEYVEYVYSRIHMFTVEYVRS